MSRRQSPNRPGLRSAALRFGLMVAVLLAAFFLFRQTELVDRLSLDRLVEIVDTVRGWWWSPLALIAGWALLSPLGSPGTPFLLAGGVVFGPWWGSLYNLIGAVAGATTSFLFARVLGHDFVAHLLGEERMERLEQRIAHYGFWPLASLRLIPFPWPVVNFGSALAGVPFWTFVTSSLLGLAPMIFTFTFFYASLGSMTAASGRETALWLIAALVLMTAFAVLRLVVRRRAPLD